jgi:hypothetical protein
MIFCKGDLSSIKHIHDSLVEFESLSGLSPSPGKSNIFFSGVSPSTKLAILDVLGFKEGNLPVLVCLSFHPSENILIANP